MPLYINKKNEKKYTYFLKKIKKIAILSSDPTVFTIKKKIYLLWWGPGLLVILDLRHFNSIINRIKKFDKNQKNNYIKMIL